MLSTKKKKKKNLSRAQLRGKKF